MNNQEHTVHNSETNSYNADAERFIPSFPAFDAEAARLHLKLLGYKEGDSVKINCLYHKSDPRSSTGGGRQLESIFPNLPWKEIQRNQMQGRCVYFAPNKAFRKAEVKECIAIFSEGDEGTIDQQLVNWRLKELPEPSIELFSGSKSIHQYLTLVTSCTPEQFAELQEDLAAHLGSGADTSLSDPNQLMRLAGAWHVSPDKDPVRVEIISSLGNTYSYEELREIIPRRPREEKAKPKHTAGGEANEMLNFVQYLNGYQENGRAGWHTAECPLSHKHHSGNHSQDSLHVEAETGAYKCHAGCDRKEVWQAARKIAIDNGYKVIKKDMSEEFKVALEEISKETDPAVLVLKKSTASNKFKVSVKDIDSLLRQKKQAEEARHVEDYVFNTDCLFEEELAEDFLVPGMLPRGGSVILAGDAKAGKTLLAYELAYAVATGGEFLGEKVPQGKVLLFQIERPKKNLQRLLKRGFSSDLLKSSVRISTKYTPEILEQELAADNYTLVIIDSLTAINVDSGVSEWNKEYADPIYKMQPHIEKANATCVIVHHLNKSNEAQGVRQLRGSSAIPGAVWGCLVLKHVLKQDPYNKKKFVIDPNETHRTLELVGLQDAGGAALDIELNVEDNSWINHGEVGISKEVVEARRTMKERILQALFNNYPNALSGMEIKEVLGITSEADWSTMRQAVSRMAERREISAKPNPKKLSSKWYYLPPSYYLEMSRNLTITYTQQPLQKRDSVLDVTDVSIATQKMSHTVSRNGNKDQESVSGKLRDNIENTEGGSVPVPPKTLLAPRGTKPNGGDLIQYVGSGELDGKGENLIVVSFSDNPGMMLSNNTPLKYIRCKKTDGSEAKFINGNVYIPIEDTIIVKQQVKA